MRHLAAISYDDHVEIAELHPDGELFLFSPCININGTAELARVTHDGVAVRDTITPVKVRHRRMDYRH